MSRKRQSVLFAAILPLGAVAFVFASAWSNRQAAGRPTLNPTFVAAVGDRDLQPADTNPLPVALAATNEYFDGSRFELGWNERAKEVLEITQPKPRSVTILQQPDGTYFTGEEYDGKPTGWGIFNDPSGTRLEGKWRYGNPDQISGRVVLPDGTVEDGTWDYVHGTGSGTITWRDGHAYKGPWTIANGLSAELPEGTGTMTWPDGHMYVGPFHDGQMNGWGTMTWANGKPMEGLWRHGDFVMSHMQR